MWLRRKCITLNGYIRKEERSKIYHPSFPEEGLYVKARRIRGQKICRFQIRKGTTPQVRS